MEINPAFFGYLLLSLATTFLVFYIPGKVITSRFFPNLNGVAISLGAGLSLWALQGYFFGLIGARNLTWVYLILSVYLFSRVKEKFKFSFKADKILLLIVFFGVLIQNLAVFPSGIRDSSGIRFYDINAFDGIYYLALSKNLITSFPPAEPGFWGHTLINYHYFSNLTIADVSRLFNLPISMLQFQTFPLLLSILLGFLAFEAGKEFAGSDAAGKIFAFLVYFGSDFGYITSLIFLKHLSITSLQPIETSSLLFTNPPRAFAEVVFLSGLLLFLYQLREKKISQLLVSSLLLISTLGFKVYFGIFSTILIVLTSLIFFIKSRNPRFLLATALTAIVAFLIYFPTNVGAGGLFFAPFSWPRHYFASGALQALNWHLQEQVFWQHNNIPRLAILYFSYTIVFLFTILGTRMLGVFDFIPKSRKETLKHYLIYVPTIVFILLGIFFLQEVGIYNTFNFFSFSALTLSLLSADFISRRVKGRNLFLIFTFVVLLTLPRPVIDAVGQTKSIGVGGYLIDNNELSALTYLKENSPRNSVILVAPGNGQDYNSPYIEYFSERPTYLSNLDILESHREPVEERKQKISEIFSGLNKEGFFLEAKNLGIDFIYVKGKIPKPISYKFTKDETFFSNDEVTILKIN